MSSGLAKYIYIFIYIYVKTKTIVYYPLRQRSRKTFAFLLTKQKITSCSVMEKFRWVNYPSCDRIRHLNHIRSLIVLSTKVNNLPFWTFSQERRCHGSVKMTAGERWVWFRMEWLTRPLPTRHDRPRVTSQRQDNHLRLFHFRNRMITTEDTTRRTTSQF